MEIKLSKACKRIYDILKDGQLHCPNEWNYADGHCKRYTDLNTKLKPLGYAVVPERCNCGIHTSPIMARRLIEIPKNIEIHKSDPHVMKWFENELKSRKEETVKLKTLF